MNLEAINKELNRLCKNGQVYIYDARRTIQFAGIFTLEEMERITEIIKRYKKDLINNN